MKQMVKYKIAIDFCGVLLNFENVMSLDVFKLSDTFEASQLKQKQIN